MRNEEGSDSQNVGQEERNFMFACKRLLRFFAVVCARLEVVFFVLFTDVNALRALFRGVFFVTVAICIPEGHHTTCATLFGIPFHTMHCTLQLFDTRTKALKTPTTSQSVTVYSCGPTLYQSAHIGNMRAYVFADTLNRALHHCGYTPKHIINLTDVGHLTDDADAGEDKVERQAKKENLSAKAITKRFEKEFRSDLTAVNIEQKRYQFPRATEFIQEQITLIQRIEKKGLTYQLKDGVYFDTTAYKSYGAFSTTQQEKPVQGRIQTVAEKHHPNDFALWKFTPEGVKRQQEWRSPWGRGFPGWHIECSAMAMRLLGEHITIHTGGIDHIPVHHTNEIAQTESVTEKPFADIWMHGAFLTIANEKLSKSLGNTYTISDLIAQGYDPTALRYFFLQASYRSPLTFSFEALSAAQTALTRLRSAYKALPHPIAWFRKAPPAKHYTKRIDAAIAEDLNTASVLALMWQVLSDKTLAPKEKRATLTYADTLLGILTTTITPIPETIPKAVTALVKERTKAREQKQFDRADTLRKEIEQLGYLVTDVGDKTNVEKNSSNERIE